MILFAIFLVASLLDEGLRLGQEGRWAEARVKFVEVTRVEPKNGLAWKAFGVASGKLGDSLEAEDAFRQGCKVDRRIEDVCYYHAQALFVLNRFEEALQVLAREPRRGRTLVAQAQAFEALGREKDAEAAFLEALKQPDFTDEARLRYGVFLFRAGRLADSERVLLEAVRKRAEFGEAIAELGRVYYQEDRIREAVGMLEKGARLRPDLEWIALLADRARRRL